VVGDVGDSVTFAAEPLDVLAYGFSFFLHDLSQVPLVSRPLVSSLELPMNWRRSCPQDLIDPAGRPMSQVRAAVERVIGK
jgi:hypothetical protein